MSLNQFILWATAEKIGALNQQLDDPEFPQVTYRRGAAATPTPILRGAGIRVQAILTAHERWGLAPAEIAAEYEVTERQVEEALAFARAHHLELEALEMIRARLSAAAHD